MKCQFIIVFATVTAGCLGSPSYPLEKCDWDAPCTSGFQCIGFRCVATCEFAGDCDLGFRCVDGLCLESCETSAECTIGVCRPLRDGQRGSACRLENLPACFDCGAN